MIYQFFDEDIRVPRKIKQYRERESQCVTNNMLFVLSSSQLSNENDIVCSSVTWRVCVLIKKRKVK
jgi:hypothetical protein